MPRFISRKHQPLAVSHPADPDVVDRILAQRLGLSHARGQQVHRCGRSIGPGHSPFAVRRESDSGAFPEPNRRRAVGLAHVNRVLGSAAFSGLGKKYVLAVRRQVAWSRPIEPGQIPLFGFPGSKPDNAGAIDAACQQDIALFADIQQGQLSRDARQNSDLSRQIDGIKRAVAAGPGGGKPDLISGGRPCQSLNAVPSAGKGRLFPGEIDYRDRAAIVTMLRMVEKRNQITLWRNSQMADPSIRFIQHFARRKFKPFSPSYVVRDGQSGSVGGPVCEFNIFQQFARSASAQGHAGQGAGIKKALAGPALERQSHLSAWTKWRARRLLADPFHATEGFPDAC